MRLPIIHENVHFLLVNKPPGVLSQPGGYQVGNLSTLLEQFSPESYGDLKIVHRLDTNVTGGMVLAKNKNAARQFHRGFLNPHSGFGLRRRYIALVNRISGCSAAGIVDKEIGGKPALTKYKLINYELKNRENVQLVLLELVTGRKHQIRNHLSTLGMSCVNDMKYGSQIQFPETRQIGLHSCWLETRIGMQLNKFMIPILFGFDIWEGFIEKDGSFVKEIRDQIEPFK